MSVDRRLYRKHEGNGNSGGKKISLKHHERMLCLGLDPIETCESSIPELLGEMLCFMGSTNQE